MFANFISEGLHPEKETVVKIIMLINYTNDYVTICLILTVSDLPFVSMGSKQDNIASTKHDPAYKDIVARSLCSTRTCYRKTQLTN